MFMDPGGIAALAFFVGLVVFVCFEGVQVARGRVHLSGILRAGLELLIMSPVIVLLVVVIDKVSEKFGLDWLEKNGLVRLFAIPLLALIWAPWTHYRASQITRRRRRRSATNNRGVSDDTKVPF
jgi:hypothetical protein